MKCIFEFLGAKSHRSEGSREHQHPTASTNESTEHDFDVGQHSNG